MAALEGMSKDISVYFCRSWVSGLGVEGGGGGRGEKGYLEGYVAGELCAVGVVGLGGVDGDDEVGELAGEKFAGGGCGEGKWEEG